MSKVYFTDLSSGSKEDNLPNRIKKLFRKVGDGLEYDEDDLVSLKLHFCEKGIDTFIRPVQVNPIIKAVKKKRVVSLS